MEEYWLRKLSSSDDKRERLEESSANIYQVPSDTPGSWVNGSDIQDLREVIVQKNHHDETSGEFTFSTYLEFNGLSIN